MNITPKLRINTMTSAMTIISQQVTNAKEKIKKKAMSPASITDERILTIS